MRNPIRLKNLSLRFAPYYIVGALLVAISEIRWVHVVVGALPVALGVALRAWGAGHLIKNDRFTVSGPYAHVRHPLYLGTILMAVGFTSMLGGLTAFASITAVLAWFGLHYFPRKERAESARLVERYGDAYLRYREAVPALVPRLRAWHPSPSDPETPDAGARWTAACYDRNNELGTLLAVVLAVGCVAARAAVG